MRNKGFTLIELMIVVVIIGVLAAIAVPNFLAMQTRAKEAGVKSNCHTVQMAAEDFSIQNTGVYAASTADVTGFGDTMIDLLPWNARLKNPFTQVQSEPIDGVAVTSGQTGYVPVADLTGTNVGYSITGMGRTIMVITLTNGQ